MKKLHFLFKRQRKSLKIICLFQKNCNFILPIFKTMKTLLLPALLIALLFAGCKKDSVTIDGNKHVNGVYLLKTATYALAGVTWTDNFTYDDQNRIATMHSTNSNEAYVYTYSGDNKLASVSITSSGALAFIEKFRYNADSVVVQQYAADGVTLYIKYAFVLSNNRVIRYLGENGYVIDYQRDSNGNVTNITGHSAGITNSVDLQYDDKKSPLADVGVNNLFALFMVNDATLGCANNLIKTSSMPNAYTYQYLDNGLPASAAAAGGQTIKFDYYIK